MKTQVFKNKVECVEHYLKLLEKRVDFTAEEVKDFLNTTVRTKEDERAGLPTYATIKRVATWINCPEVYVELFFPEYAELPYMWNVYILTFKEQENGTYLGEVPDFKILG